MESAAGDGAMDGRSVVWPMTSGSLNVSLSFSRGLVSGVGVMDAEGRRDGCIFVDRVVGGSCRVEERLVVRKGVRSSSIVGSIVWTGDMLTSASVAPTMCWFALSDGGFGAVPAHRSCSILLYPRSVSVEGIRGGGVSPVGTASSSPVFRRCKSRIIGRRDGVFRHGSNSILS
jgi:hypothetical protein